MNKILQKLNKSWILNKVSTRKNLFDRIFCISERMIKFIYVRTLIPSSYKIKLFK